MYGYIYLVEADSPSSMRNYLEAYARAGVEDPEVLLFYELHIDADVGHADVALNEVVAPVLRGEPEAAADIARGIVEGRYLHALFGGTFTAGSAPTPRRCARERREVAPGSLRRRVAPVDPEGGRDRGAGAVSGPLRWGDPRI